MQYVNERNQLDGNSFCLQMWRCRFCWWNSHWEKKLTIKFSKQLLPWYEQRMYLQPQGLLWKIKIPLGWNININMILNSHLTKCRSCGIKKILLERCSCSLKPLGNLSTASGRPFCQGWWLIKCSRENKNVFEAKTRVSANKSFFTFYHRRPTVFVAFAWCWNCVVFKWKWLWCAFSWASAACPRCYMISMPFYSVLCNMAPCTGGR